MVCIIEFELFFLLSLFIIIYENDREAIKEDDDGLVESAIADIIQKAKRKRQSEKKGHSRLGMMRHLYIILDCSEAMMIPDLKPTRFICSLKLLNIFIEEFFDQNPISQLGVILLKSKRAEKLTELGGSCKKHIKALDALKKNNLIGEPSIQNGLDLALQTLKMVPTHASREVLLIMGSLTTCDPSDIGVTIESLKQECIRCSVISLSTEIRLFKFLTHETGGVFGAVLDDSHYKDQLLQHIDPPPAAVTQEFSLIKMGFPHGQNEDTNNPQLSMCMCHMDSTGDPSKLKAGGYHCPQCFSKYCELPVECIACNLTLVSAPHLARSYHHLFPIQLFVEKANNFDVSNCYACQKVFNDSDKNVSVHIY